MSSIGVGAISRDSPENTVKKPVDIGEIKDYWTCLIKAINNIPLKYMPTTVFPLPILLTSRGY